MRRLHFAACLLFLSYAVHASNREFDEPALPDNGAYARASRTTPLEDGGLVPLGSDDTMIRMLLKPCGRTKESLKWIFFFHELLKGRSPRSLAGRFQAFWRGYARMRETERVPYIQLLMTGASLVHEGMDFVAQHPAIMGRTKPIKGVRSGIIRTTGPKTYGDKRDSVERNAHHQNARHRGTTQQAVRKAVRMTAGRERRRESALKV